MIVVREADLVTASHDNACQPLMVLHRKSVLIQLRRSRQFGISYIGRIGIDEHTVPGLGEQHFVIAACNLCPLQMLRSCLHPFPSDNPPPVRAQIGCALYPVAVENYATIEGGTVKEEVSQGRIGIGIITEEIEEIL